MEALKGNLRHRFWYGLGRVLSPITLKNYSYTTDVMEKFDEPSIILSNHLTESDMFMINKAFKPLVYFVGGEHLLRSKIGPFLKHIADPISAPRGGKKLTTVMQIIRRVKQGYNVAIFPEGCRSFNGETLKVSLATAKLIKKAGSGLVTYKIHGGYFAAPRWAYKFRKGHVSGEIVNVYSSSEISNMTTEELLDHINDDLYENAYEYQSKAQIKYTCGNLAEGLENYLVICPNCGRYDTLITDKDQFKCIWCEMSGKYNEYGMLEGENLPYSSVYDWGKWMEGRFFDDLRASKKALQFTEKDITLYEVTDDHQRKDIATGDLYIYKDHMKLKAKKYEHSFIFSDISEKSLLYYGKTFLFTDSTGYYGMTGEKFHAWKLDKIFDFTRNQSSEKSE